jgi:hypothetical protein
MSATTEGRFTTPLVMFLQKEIGPRRPRFNQKKGPRRDNRRGP